MKIIKLFVIALAVLIMPWRVFSQEERSTVETVTSIETAGTISEVSPDTIVIRKETNSAPMNYSYTKRTTYVDETGAPISLETVKAGQPVTVHYTREGDHMIADKIVILKTTTTTKTEPIIQEKHTSTTTITTEETK